jgi:hypothetical protein
LRAAQNGSAFSIGRNQQQEKEVPKALTLTKVVRSPSDEITLTELACDSKDIETLEINLSILMAEEEQANPKGNFRCFMDNNSKEFFIEIANVDAIKTFTSSVLVNVLELAEQAGSTTVYICLRKNIEKKSAYLKSFLFVGFQQLTEEEQNKISMTRTHSILKYSADGQEVEF